eukprot:m.250427 g.250427  ORF g.250427 m.250427 type:complete len:149 (-) comp17176_c0_seq3:2991-3437(-)
MSLYTHYCFALLFLCIHLHAYCAFVELNASFIFYLPCCSHLSKHPQTVSANTHSKLLTIIFIIHLDIVFCIFIFNHIMSDEPPSHVKSSTIKCAFSTIVNPDFRHVLDDNLILYMNQVRVGCTLLIKHHIMTLLDMNSDILVDIGTLC